MRISLQVILLLVLLASASCTRTHSSSAWVVEETEIALYHSSTADPESGYILHVEYCAAKLSSGPSVLHIVYRPIDFPDRNPGFAKGDTITVTGLDKAKDFGAVEGRDYWITHIKIAKSANKPDAGDGR